MPYGISWVGWGRVLREWPLITAGLTCSLIFGTAYAYSIRSPRLVWYERAASLGTNEPLLVKAARNIKAVGIYDSHGFCVFNKPCVPTAQDGWGYKA